MVKRRNIGVSILVLFGYLLYFFWYSATYFKKVLFFSNIWIYAKNHQKGSNRAVKLGYFRLKVTPFSPYY